LQITIKFFSTLRTIVGLTEDHMEFPVGVSLHKIMDDLQKKYFVPKNSRLLAEDGQRLEIGMICLIDDTDINLMGGIKHRLQKDATITLISSLHGG
ncbi:MAG: MoaD/ThiS family protein, partial [Promethearchaeota archaeon]